MNRKKDRSRILDNVSTRALNVAAFSSFRGLGHQDGTSPQRIGTSWRLPIVFYGENGVPSSRYLPRFHRASPDRMYPLEFGRTNGGLRFKK
jgi:hypothetical protein